MRLALIVSLIIVLAAVVFAMQNPGPMSINIPFSGSQLVSTQPVVLITTLLIGLVIGVLASLPGRIGVGLRARKAEKRLAELEAERTDADPHARVSVVPEVSHATHDTDRADASETQRLADEVARRTSTEASGRRPVPPRDDA